MRIRLQRLAAHAGPTSVGLSGIWKTVGSLPAPPESSGDCSSVRTHLLLTRMSSAQPSKQWTTALEASLAKLDRQLAEERDLRAREQSQRSAAEKETAAERSEREAERRQLEAALFFTFSCFGAGRYAQLGK